VTIEYEIKRPLFAPALSLDPLQHAGSLEREALSALHQSRFVEAYALADRRCRIRPLASAEAFLLRASALARLGENDAACDDFRLALSIDPDNLAANRFMMTAGKGGERLVAAHRLLAQETDWNRLRQVLQLLNSAGHSPIGSFRAGLAAIEGWVVWSEESNPALHVEGDAWSGAVSPQPDEEHPLADAQHAAAMVTIPWARVGDNAVLRFAEGRAVLDGAKHARPQRTPRAAPVSRRRTSGAQRHARRRVAVIVPVYDDFEATRNCFEALLADRPSLVDRRIVAVDDAAPDRRIAAYLDRLHERGAIELLRNARNLGFAASVNAALDVIDDEDVCLLNADALVPQGFLDGLSRSANSRPDVGTATPLSNNGEYTSFPVAFRSNDLPDAAAIARLHRAAAAVNAGLTVELPNGIGFCLYITNSCLRSVGKFSQRFGRGYYEDVEFCLRARAAGWRNICAADVFVGHAGSRSFKTEKVLLVHRNAKLVAAAYRGFDVAAAAFVEQDPLDRARQALERELLPGCKPFVLLVVPDDMDRSSVEEAVAAEGAAGESIVVARVAGGAGRVSLRLRESNGQIPQNLTLSHARCDAVAGLRRDLARAPVSRCVVCDPSRMPLEVLKVLPPSGKAVTVRVRDRGLLCWLNRTGGRCPTCQGQCICAIEGPHPGALSRTDPKMEQEALVALLRMAGSIVVPDRRMKDALERLVPELIGVIEVAQPPILGSPVMGEYPTLPRMGVWGEGAQPSMIKLVTEVARAFGRADEDASLIYFGGTASDLDLKAAGTVFVTGEANQDEAAQLARRLSVSKMFFPSRRLEPPAAMKRLCEALSLPLARFGERDDVDGFEGDLYLPPSMKAHEVARALHDWVLAP
jgi:GT2 family glycosyltransferase